MALATDLDRYTLRRLRAAELSSRYAHAAEVLSLYQALLQVQQVAYETVVDQHLPASAAIGYAAERVLPRVLEATTAAGPPLLVTRVVARFHVADASEIIGRWLAGEPQPAVDRFLARASTEPVLEALGEEVSAICSGSADDRHCPTCGGLPQLSYIAAAEEALVTAPRRLLCSRCHASWSFARMSCPGCGETAGSQLPIYSEEEMFPHLRVEGCRRCRQYLMGVDLRRDPAAVPVVDEMAALPLDLYARERGLRKLMPNLMEH